MQNIFFAAGPKSGPALILTAHYDSVEASPGFGDDGIGVAVWLEAAHWLKQHPPEKPVLFLLTDGEETALLASIVGNPSKVYDGSSTAVLTSANYSLTGFVGSDAATINQTVGQYDSTNAGNRTVTATLATLIRKVNHNVKHGHESFVVCKSGQVGPRPQDIWVERANAVRTRAG